LRGLQRRRGDNVNWIGVSVTRADSSLPGVVASVVATVRVSLLSWSRFTENGVRDVENLPLNLLNSNCTGKYSRIFIRNFLKVYLFRRSLLCGLLWLFGWFRIASGLSHHTGRFQPLHLKQVKAFLRTATVNMEQQRGRSPSAGHQQSNISRTHSPSPQLFQENTNSVGLGVGLDPTNNNQQYINGGFNPNNNLSSYVDTEFINQQGQSFAQSGIGESTYVQSQDFNQRFDQEKQISPFGQQQAQEPSFTQELLGANNFSDGDFSLFSTPNTQAEQYDPSFFVNDLPSPPNQTLNPSEINMPSPQIHHSPTPPALLQPDSHSNSAHQSPSFSQGQFQPTSHSRNASLGPESAAYPQGHEWGMMPPQFTGHRRTPSEYSDVSVPSAQPSPNLGHHDTFDSIEQHHSPMQNAQDAGLYQEVLGIGSFSLSDPQIQHGSSPGRGLSPAHSPAISPRLLPQQLPNVNNQNSFMLGINGFPSQSMYGGQSQESFPQIQQNDMGQSTQMVPDINVEFAPTSRQNSFEPPKPSFDQDALTPPDRGTLQKRRNPRMVAN
jgi:hypothetical protein